MKTLLVASRNRTTCKAIHESLKDDYKLSLLKSADNPVTCESTHQLIIVDSEFTAKNGIDVLIELRARSTSPILYLVPIESPHYAIEALKRGAFNFIVKSPNYPSLLSCSVKLALDQHQQIKKLTDSNRKLIAYLKSAEQAKQDQQTTSNDNSNSRKTLIQEIRDRLKQGEVNLPSIPDLILKVNDLVENDASVTKFASVISNDAAITTGLIRISNSSHYRGVTENRTLDQAINRLGIEQSMVYVQMISNRSLFATKDKLLSPLFKRLWQHCMACAHASQIISTKLKIGNCYEIFMMGLLHDVGALFLLQVIAEVRAGGDQCQTSTSALYALIREHHESFGSNLLQAWQFPREFVEVSSFHEHPEECNIPSDNLLVVNLANRVVNSNGYAFEAEGIPFKDLKSDAGIGLDEAILAGITSEVLTVVDALQSELS